MKDAPTSCFILYCSVHTVLCPPRHNHPPPIHPPPAAMSSLKKTTIKNKVKCSGRLPGGKCANCVNWVAECHFGIKQRTGPKPIKRGGGGGGGKGGRGNGSGVRLTALNQSGINGGGGGGGGGALKRPYLDGGGGGTTGDGAVKRPRLDGGGDDCSKAANSHETRLLSPLASGLGEQQHNQVGVVCRSMGCEEKFQPNSTLQERQGSLAKCE